MSLTSLQVLPSNNSSFDEQVGGQFSSLTLEIPGEGYAVLDECPRLSAKLPWSLPEGFVSAAQARALEEYLADAKVGKKRLGSGRFGIVLPLGKDHVIKLIKQVVVKSLNKTQLESLDSAERKERFHMLVNQYRSDQGEHLNKEAEAIFYWEGNRLTQTPQIGFPIALIVAPRRQIDLQRYIEKRKKPLSIKQTLKMSLKISYLVKDLIQRRIVHGDLRPPNILLDERKEPHLADFGIARKFSCRQGLGAETDCYAPPEGRAGTPSKQDIFPLGCLIYFMRFKKAPQYFESRSEIGTPLEELYNGTHEVEVEERFSIDRTIECAQRQLEKLLPRIQDKRQVVRLPPITKVNRVVQSRLLEIKKKRCDYRGCYSNHN